LNVVEWRWKKVSNTQNLQLPCKWGKRVETGMFEVQRQHFRLLTVNGLRNQQKRKCYAKAVPHHKRLVAGFLPRRPGFDPGSGHMTFVVDRVALRQVFFEYFSFLCQWFHRLLHTHRHPSSGAGRMGQMVTDVRSGLSLTPPQQRELLTLLWGEGNQSEEIIIRMRSRAKQLKYACCRKPSVPNTAAISCIRRRVLQVCCSVMACGTDCICYLYRESGVTW
jgi:hypothetical protein